MESFNRGGVIIDPPRSKVQSENWHPRTRRLTRSGRGEGNHTSTPVSDKKTLVFTGKYDHFSRTDRNYPPGGMSRKAVAKLLGQLADSVGRYSGRKREPEHATNVVIGCVVILGQIPGIDPNGWLHRRQPSTRRQRCDILRNVAKRPHGKDHKATLRALLTYTISCVEAASFLESIETGALPLTWRL